MLIERYPDDNPVQALLRRRDASEPRSPGAHCKMVRESDILDEAYRVAIDFRDRAISALDVLPDSEPHESLVDVANWVAQRRF